MNTNRLPLDPELARTYMRQWATGVTVVSAAQGDVQHGMTVSSFTSITMEPPRLLVSIARLARTHRLIDQSRSFGVTILHQDQQDISEIFAGRIGDDDERFAGLETFTLVTGSPLLRGGLAFFDCIVQLAIDVSDVTLFVGEVVAVEGVQDTNSPLIYYNRDYHRLKKPSKSP